MGDFKGHVFPGVSIALIALRWMYCIFYRYFLCQRERTFTNDHARKFESSLTFPSWIFPKFPLEAALWFIAVLGLMIGEAAGIQSFRWGMDQFQHLMIDYFYLFPPAIILLRHFRVNLFPGMEYAALLMTQAVAVFVFTHHMHGKSQLENQLHVNSSISFSIGFVALALEMKYRHVPLAAVFRAYSAFVAGTWLTEIGFILYPLNGAPRPEDTHFNSELATLSFVGQYGVSIMITAIMALIAKLVVRRKSSSRVVVELDFETGIKRTPANARSKFSMEDATRLLESAEDEL